jgi:hypothetical protein
MDDYPALSWWPLYATLLVIGLFAAGVAYVIFDVNDTTKPDAPFGCAYVDVDPGKGVNAQLACVEGYHPEGTEHEH